MKKISEIRPRSPERASALLRIGFGAVWLVNAWLKWQPGFLNGFASYISGAADGQPGWVQAWLGFWSSVVAINPHLFGVIVACIETALALGLLFGVFMDVILPLGVVFACFVWAIPEAFGGPYTAGATDVGASIIYVFVFISLWIGNAESHFSLRSRRTRA